MSKLNAADGAEGSNSTLSVNGKTSITAKMAHMERFRIDRQRKLDEMKAQVQALREQKIAKHAERVRQMKEGNLKKAANSAEIRRLPQPVKSTGSLQTKSETSVKQNVSLKPPIREFNKPHPPVIAPKKDVGLKPPIREFKKPQPPVIPKQNVGLKPIQEFKKPQQFNVAPKLSIGVVKNIANNVKPKTAIPLKKEPTLKKNAEPTTDRSVRRFSMATANRLAQPKKYNAPPIDDQSKKTNTTDFKNIVCKKPPAEPKSKKSNGIDVKPTMPRRSLSTVHFERVSAEVKRKHLSRSRSMVHFKNYTPASKFEQVSIDKKIILPVKSEAKKMVTFLTPTRQTFGPNVFLNTPKPNELRKRLNDWLQRRGKSLSQYSHLHCFGIHEALKTKSKHEDIVDKENEEHKENEENKENEELVNDEDDDSLSENIHGKVKNMAEGWRETKAEEADFLKDTSNESIEEEDNIVPKQTENLDHIMIQALNDLRQLISDGYPWNQCEEWLRTIMRNCSEKITDTAAYWECRAALEERRGDFSEAVECYNRAIQQGAKPSTVDSSLDHLLDKFMKLNLNPYPNDNTTQQQSKNYLDIKNVFKSTIIKFAIHQKQSLERDDYEPPGRFTATPVRRSTRLSLHQTVYEKTQTPLLENSKKDINNSLSKSSARKHLIQICNSLTDFEKNTKQTLSFIPNKALKFD